MPSLRLLTIKAPVTNTIIPPCWFDGCASLVSTRCWTFWKGRFWGLCQAFSSHSEHGVLTCSFSTMFAVPWNGACSKVSMDCSRLSLYQYRSTSFNATTHIEGSQLCAIGIEGLVVVIDELVYASSILFLPLPSEGARYLGRTGDLLKI